MAKVDWIKLKTEYASSTISYRKMADKYGISFNTLKDHAGIDKWAEARKKFTNTVTKKTIQSLASKKASTCVKQLRRVAGAADTATAMIERMMRDADQFRRHLIIVKKGVGTGRGEYEENQEVEERIYDKVDTKSLKEFTGALKDLATVIRNVNGLPTVIEEAAMDIAAQRLILEQQKADADDNSTVEGADVSFADQDAKEMSE